MNKVSMKLSALLVTALAVVASAQGEETVLRGLSPDQAMEKIREMKKNKSFPDHDVVFELEGTFSYPKTALKWGERDGGKSPNARVVFRAGKKGATLTGACCLPKTSFKKISDNAVRSRLRAEVRDKVLCCDLKPFGVDRLDQLPDKLRAWNGMEFFAGGEPQTIARYPNQGWLEFSFEDVVDSGTEMDKNLRELRGVRGGTFHYAADDPRPATWDVSKGVWALGFWNNDWTSDTLRLEKIDGAAHTVTTKGIHYLGIGPFKAGDKVARRYYFLNLFEELDSPGEWYVDCEKAILYWYPPKNIPDDLKFVNHAEPILQCEYTSNLAFEGIRFEGNTAAALYFHGGSDVTLRDCEVSYITRSGIEIHGGNGYLIDGCRIHHVGCHGIEMETFKRKLLRSCNSRITNCEIYRVGRFVTNGRGMVVDCVGLRIDHNYVHDVPYNGITYRGNDNVLEFNEIAFAMMESGDGGGFYTGRDWTSQGNIVRYNYLHHFGALGAQEKLRRGEKLFCEPLKHDDSNGIYIDDCDSGDTCYGNLIFKVGYGFQLGGGRDNLIRNNFIAGCMHGAALVDARGFKLLRFDGGSCNGWNMKKRLDDMEWDKDPFKSRYPWTQDYLANDKLFPVRTSFSSNVVVSCKNVIGQGSCKERKDFVHDMNFKDNVAYGPRGPRDKDLYPENGKYDAQVRFVSDDKFEKMVTDAEDLRKVYQSKEFRERFPNFPEIPVRKIGIR